MKILEKKKSVRQLIYMALWTCTVLAYAFNSLAQPVIDVPASPAPAFIDWSMILNLSSDGVLPENFSALKTSTVNISGGTLSERFSAQDEATVNVHGGDFRLGGQLIPGLTELGDEIELALPDDQTLTATLSDGTPIVFSRGDIDLFGVDSTLRLKRTMVPYAPGLIHVASHNAPQGVHGGQNLLLNDGGTLVDNFNGGFGSRVDIFGGTIGRNFEAASAEINVDGTAVGFNFDAFLDSAVHFSNAIVGVNASGADNAATAFDSSMMRFTDSTVGDALVAVGQATLTIENSQVGERLTLGDHATLNTNGATIGDNLWASGNSIVNITNSAVGSSLQVRDNASLIMNSGSLGSSAFVKGTGTHQFNGGTAGNNTVFQGDVEVTIDGTQFGSDLLFRDNAKAMLLSGSLGRDVTVNRGATMTIAGGIVGDDFSVGADSVVHIQDGKIGALSDAGFGSLVNISGGEIGFGITIFDNATVNVTGGTFNPDGFGATLLVHANANLNLFGHEFLLDGVPIPGLEDYGDTLLLTERGGAVLSGVLLDGSPIEFTLNEVGSLFVDGIDPEANLRLTIAVPEPNSLVLLMFGLGMLAIHKWSKPTNLG